MKRNRPESVIRVFTAAKRCMLFIPFFLFLFWIINKIAQTKLQKIGKINHSAQNKSIWIRLLFFTFFSHQCFLLLNSYFFQIYSFWTVSCFLHIRTAHSLNTNTKKRNWYKSEQILYWISMGKQKNCWTRTEKTHHENSKQRRIEAKSKSHFNVLNKTMCSSYPNKVRSPNSAWKSTTVRAAIHHASDSDIYPETKTSQLK